FRRRSRRPRHPVSTARARAGAHPPWRRARSRRWRGSFRLRLLAFCVLGPSLREAVRELHHPVPRLPFHTELKATGRIELGLFGLQHGRVFPEQWVTDFVGVGL